MGCKAANAQHRKLRLTAVTLTAFLTLLVVGLLSFAPPTSPLSYPQTRVAAIGQPTGQFVGAHESVLAVQGRERAPNYDLTATGSSVAAEGEGAGSLDLSTEESWGDLAKLEDHFLRHGPDFNSGSADEYAQQASQFLQQIDQEGLEIKVAPNGTIRIYDPSTNTFGSFNPDGTTKTFFQPTSGAAYWANQPGASPWGGS